MAVKVLCLWPVLGCFSSWVGLVQWQYLEPKPLWGLTQGQKLE